MGAIHSGSAACQSFFFPSFPQFSPALENTGVAAFLAGKNGEILEGFLAWLAERRAKNIICKSAKMKFARTKDGQRIVGLNTENAEINEGLIRFDIIFFLWMKDGISQVIVNLEIQKDEPTGYHILNRAVFYVSRLVSSQEERDFVMFSGSKTVTSDCLF